jgi:hypothetical protein
MTDIFLRGGTYSACPGATPNGRGTAAPRSAGTAAAAASRRGATAGGRTKAAVIRRLWASDRHGRFRTHGLNSVATVRGTVWSTTDRCDGTLTRVGQGQVSVRDRRRGRSVLVPAGRSYLARRGR